MRERCRVNVKTSKSCHYQTAAARLVILEQKHRIHDGEY